MFTGGTIWVLSHGQVSATPAELFSSGDLWGKQVYDYGKIAGPELQCTGCGFQQPFDPKAGEPKSASHQMDLSRCQFSLCCFVLLYYALVFFFLHFVLFVLL